MAIKKNAGGGGGNYIREPGEYRVKVKETKMGKAKSGKDMLTVTFITCDDREISGYFLRNTGNERVDNINKAAMRELKLASGMGAEEHHENLIGREIGILVEPQKPNEQGHVFMRIAGYGSASDVTSTPAAVTGEPAQAQYKDEIPF